MGYGIFVGPLGGSANSDVVGFGGGLEGRPEIVKMDPNRPDPNDELYGAVFPYLSKKTGSLSQPSTTELEEAAPPASSSGSHFPLLSEEEKERALNDEKQKRKKALSGLLCLNKTSIPSSYPERIYQSLHLDQEKDPRILEEVMYRIDLLCSEHNGLKGSPSPIYPPEVKKRLMTWLEDLRKYRRPEDG